ncbi:MAG: hypothetical protein K0R46_452 [Herbinix sp.]|jgi:NitT/TauT family transport system ATP-binding protein|nr:hypothetical protein [Herbinix sp.]
MAIEVIHITKHFGDHMLFDDLNLTFMEGQMNCLMGASGSGKSALVNMLLGLMRPDSGEIKGLSGKRIAAVFQEDRLIEHWDAVKNIKLVCGKSISEQRIEQELKLVGIEDYADKAVKYFSGGMRRRVAIVRALLANSDVLILDEPFKGLDEALKVRVIEYVIDRTKGKTVLLVTHDKEEVSRLSGNLFTL